MEIFGPIPSRRLGRSLGINNIPPKACSYYCTYCQVGPTEETEIALRHFYGADYLVKLVKERVAQLKKQGEAIDHLSFVPDGEPTLDADLGETIDKLRPLGIKIAIITNGSLLWREDVRETLKKADWVSLKVDTVDEKIWHRLNIPHRNLKLTSILEGMMIFAKEYKGTLVTETMLVKDRNVSEKAAIGIANFIHRLEPKKAYFLIPTRPPAISTIYPPSEAELNQVYQIVSRKISNIEYLTGYEGNAFVSTGNPTEDLLSITAVHPMREEAVRELLATNQADWIIVENLLREGKIMETEYEGKIFYMRRFTKK
ncbi:MAG: radical SAM protein [Gammaproteobacteria bacterium]|nr:MAG: radical SAM protein [Gammaproteobacteria bacterium]RKZ40214.1 MAG: radical SAM protein [Gammaproteobacteria bacterium]RKZ73882.1 MAG: radical SAM protein [Gammaproteobacteria bacterium]